MECNYYHYSCPGCCKIGDAPVFDPFLDASLLSCADVSDDKDVTLDIPDRLAADVDFCICRDTNWA